MATINNIRGYVLQALIENPDARNDDDILYAEVCKRLNNAICVHDLYTIFCNRARYALPSYGTVSRLRRKLQEDNESLKGDKVSTDKRYDQWKKVRKAMGYDI